MGAGLLQGAGVRSTDRRGCVGSLWESDSLSGDGSARIPLRRPCLVHPSPQRMEEQGHPSVSVGLPSAQMGVRLGRCKPAFTRLDPVYQHRDAVHGRDHSAFGRSSDWRDIAESGRDSVWQRAGIRAVFGLQVVEGWEDPVECHLCPPIEADAFVSEGV